MPREITLTQRVHGDLRPKWSDGRTNCVTRVRSPSGGDPFLHMSNGIELAFRTKGGGLMPRAI